MDKVTMDLSVHERQLVESLRRQKAELGYDEGVDYASMVLMVSRVYMAGTSTRTCSNGTVMMEPDQEEQPLVCAMLLRQNAAGLAELLADAEERLKDAPPLVRDATPAPMKPDGGIGRVQ